LAFELFNNWEVPFILLGVMMVIAMQAGVFLAREELND
jgi:NADH:ubiquinone oxidoreductase subunit 6 (subunit J)